MQQFYYLAVLFVAGGIGSALIVAADLRTRRQPMRIMESVWVLTALWASFSGYGPISPSDAPHGTCPRKTTAPESRKAQ